MEDPLLGIHPSDRLRVVFSDGSWLTVVTDEKPSDIHKYLMRLPCLGSTGAQRSPLLPGD
ncbi:hypothetical protein ACWD00_08545 [Streptomyces viridiviolaceus]